MRNVLHALRQHLGTSAIVSAGNDLVGLDPAYLSCDASDLEHGTNPEMSARDASEIEPLQGLYVTGAPAFEEWMSAECARLRTLLARSASSSPTRSIATAGTARNPPMPRPHLPDAFAMCARGNYLFLRSAHGGATQDLLRSRDYFERARTLDPSYAPALAGLSNFYAVAARRGVLTPFHDVFNTAIALSKETVALDPTLATPHVHFGVKALWLDDDFDRAGVEFRAAVSLEPGYAEGHRFLGVWFGLDGRHDDAVRSMESAVELEPDIPQMLNSLGAALATAGRYAEAETVLRRTLTLDESHGAARQRLVRLMEDQGRIDDALAERLRVPPLSDAELYRAAREDHGETGYTETLRDILRTEARMLEAQIMARHLREANEIFAPSIVRLVSIYERLGEAKRAKAWRLQGIAERQGLARWFDATRERRGATDPH